MLPRPSLPAPQSNDKIGLMLRDGGYGMVDVTQEARRATGEPKSRAPMRGIARGLTEGRKTPPLSPATRMTRHRCPTDWSRGRPGWMGSRRLSWPERLDSTRAGQTWTCPTPRNAGQCAGINCYIGPTWCNGAGSRRTLVGPAGCSGRRPDDPEVIRTDTSRSTAGGSPLTVSKAAMQVGRASTRPRLAAVAANPIRRHRVVQEHEGQSIVAR